VVINIDGDVVGTVLERHHHGWGAVRQGVVDQVVQAALQQVAIQTQADRWDRDLNAIRAVALGELPAEGLQIHLVDGGGIRRFDRNRIEIPIQGQQGIQVSLKTRQGVGVKSLPVLEGLNPQLQARERAPNVMGNAIEVPLARFGLAVERLEQQVDAMAEQQ
jgi:hypothetical protein